MSGMVDTQLLLSVSMTVMGAPGGFPFVRLNKMFMWLEVFSEGKALDWEEQKGISSQTTALSLSCFSLNNHRF